MKVSSLSFLASIFIFASASYSYAGGMEEESSESKPQRARATLYTGVTTSSLSARPQASSSKMVLSEYELGKYQYCGKDSDCAIATNGCCDCANGSPDVSVNKERLEDFRSRFSCSNIRCGSKDAYPTCGSGLVSCISHKCEYLEQ